MIACVESLTLRTWCRSILPFVMRRGRNALARWYVLEASRPGWVAARLMGWVTGVPVEMWRYRVEDIRDEQGCSVWLQILYGDLQDVCAEAIREPLIQQVMADAGPARPRLPMYLVKAMSQATTRLAERQTVWRALFVVRVCAWQRHREPAHAGGEVVCFLERRPWLSAISRYAARCGVRLVPTAATASPRVWVKARLPWRLLEGCRQAMAWWHARCPRVSARPAGAAAAAASAEARLAVDYYGHLNLDHPEQHSDLFFWQRSSLPADRILITFRLSEAPLDGAKWAELTGRGMSAIATHPAAAAVPHAPVFVPNGRARPAGRPRKTSAAPARTPEERWVNDQEQAYARTQAFWAEVFAARQVKIYVSWFKTTEAHCAIADALHERGGVLALYQRSYEGLPSAQMSAAADIVFGFSPASAEIEQRSGSQIPYFVVTGYLGDHRPALLREQACALRQRLQGQGVTRIVAFCDENSRDEARWIHGHALARESYAFWLDQVLRHPWFGLIIKPKAPSSLRRRLGPVVQLLERAQATGRCVLFEEGQMQGSAAPAAAALAADLLVHGHLWAATAGVESALAGVPTLIMDREGWPVSPFYRLGLGRVVFTEWDALWNACLEHWRRPGGIPGFGDWSPMAQELDPFRDGRAAERMGTYLHWLLQGFDAGLDRAAVMADAAERYAAAWGRHHVLAVNADRPAQPASAGWLVEAAAS